jgi:hypothetical protein
VTLVFVTRGAGTQEIYALNVRNLEKSSRPLTLKLRKLEADLQRAWHRDPVVLLQQENRRKRSTLYTPRPN